MCMEMCVPCIMTLNAFHIFLPRSYNMRNAKLQNEISSWIKFRWYNNFRAVCALIQRVLILVSRKLSKDVDNIQNVCAVLSFTTHVFTVSICNFNLFLRKNALMDGKLIFIADILPYIASRVYVIFSYAKGKNTLSTTMLYSILWHSLKDIVYEAIPWGVLNNEKNAWNSQKYKEII